ncbi:hypothetical protein PPACK8108_LOCUS12230 [Phakopsora pachyrhizi]|uniref:Uncharacterized protein n=1 Tax=Phakopsora pachyrhizi TaxID=170000 RepID=A0AAV0B1H6_PHAPC|nr:hypothetical protein PPACK8108_LOCUS12230 [Phakopsora pachyrhizi]
MQSKASQLQEPLRRKSKEGKAKKYSKTVNSISKPHRNKSNNKSNKFHTLEQDLVSDSETEPESSSNSSVLSNQSSTPIESVSGSSSSLSSAFSQSDNSEMMEYVEKQTIGDPLDIEERASPSPSFSRKNLGLPISSSDSSLELHTRPCTRKFKISKVP